MGVPPRISTFLIWQAHSKNPTSLYELPFRPKLGSREPIVYRGYSFVSQYITSLFPRLKIKKKGELADGLKAVGAFFPRLYSRFIFSKFTNRTCATRTCLRSPPAGSSPRTPRRRLSFALGRRAVATGVPDDLPAVPESAAAAAAAPMGTPGNVPAGPV